MMGTMFTISDLDETVHIHGLKNILGHVCVMYLFQKMTTVHQKLEKVMIGQHYFVERPRKKTLLFVGE